MAELISLAELRGQAPVAFIQSLAVACSRIFKHRILGALVVMDGGFPYFTKDGARVYKPETAYERLFSMPYPRDIEHDAFQLEAVGFVDLVADEVAKAMSEDEQLEAMIVRAKPALVISRFATMSTSTMYFEGSHPVLVIAVCLQIGLMPKECWTG